MTITEPVHQPLPDSDWVAWLKTDDGINVRVQIGPQASEARAREIVEHIASTQEATKNLPI